METQAQVVSPDIQWLASQGYGVYTVLRGRMNRRAKFAIADRHDDADGFYLEGHDLLRLAEQAVDHLKGA